MKGDYEKAIECFDKALKVDPNYHVVRSDKRMAEQKLNELKEKPKRLTAKLSKLKSRIDELKSKGITINLNVDHVTTLINSGKLDEAEKELNRIEYDLQNIEKGYEKRIALLAKIKELEQHMAIPRSILDAVNTNPDYAEKALNDLISKAKPEVSIKLNQTRFYHNKWHRTKLTITNTGSVHAFNLAVSFPDDIEIRGIKPVSVRANETKTIEFGMRPKYAGEIPLELSIAFEDSKGKKYEEIHEMWIEVVDTPSTGPKDLQRVREPQVIDSAKPTTPKTFPPELAENYIEVEFIGKGGFARVFKAKRKDGKVVAVKIPISLDPATGKSFLRELMNWTKLDHENIVNVYDYNILPIPYFEMELCDQSLADLPKPIEPEKASWIIFNVAEGLKYAHKQGIIHRDLKPQNIMLKDGIPKISDWGLSKVMAESKSSSATVFTPYYASPEQISKKFGSRSDPRVDIWQLGVIFYELVTGELPFKGEDFVEITMNIVSSEPIPPSHLNPEAKEVEPIIMKCLQKDQSGRYNSIEELQQDLAKILNISYQKSLKLSISERNFSRSAYYCGELLLINLKIKDLASAYKFASDLVYYAKEELKLYIAKFCDELEFWLDRDVTDSVIEELIKKAEILVHKLRVSFKII